MEETPGKFPAAQPLRTRSPCDGEEMEAAPGKFTSAETMRRSLRWMEETLGKFSTAQLLRMRRPRRQDGRGARFLSDSAAENDLCSLTTPSPSPSRREEHSGWCLSLLTRQSLDFSVCSRLLFLPSFASTKYQRAPEDSGWDTDSHEQRIG